MIIKILNENDNSPLFDKATYNFNVHFTVQGIVGEVKAYDADNTFEEISYKLLPSQVR